MIKHVRTLKNVLSISAGLLAISLTGPANADAYNPNNNWFMSSHYGIWVQWINGYNGLNAGNLTDWNTLVDGFNVNNFANQVQATGAKYVIFSIGQGSPYWAAPNTTANNLFAAAGLPSVQPNRDLISDLYTALNAKDIKLMLYGIPGINNDANYDAAIGYNNNAQNGFTETWRQNIMAINKEFALRYGAEVVGWWEDGVNNYNSGYTTSDWDTYAADLKAGNSNSIVTLNQGNFTLSGDITEDDYTSGEQWWVTLVPQSRWAPGAANGMQWHETTYLGTNNVNWGGDGTQYPTAYLTQYVKQVADREGVITINPYVDKNGNIATDQMVQLQAVNCAVNGPQYGAKPAASYLTDVAYNDPNMIYSGSWSQETGGGQEQAVETNSAGAYVQYSFTGSSVTLFGCNSGSNGMAGIYIDGNFQTNIDEYGTSVFYPNTVPVYTNSNLSNGPHTIKMVALGSHSSASTGNTVEFKAVQYSGGNRAYVDDTDPSVVYSGTWSGLNSSAYWNGTGHYTTSSGSYSQYTFTGNEIAWYGAMGPDHGKADVYLDGNLKTTIDEYAALRQTNTILYAATGLSNAPHTIQIVERSDRNSSSSNNFTEVDAFEVTTGGKTVVSGTYDDQDYTTVNYSGSGWSHNSSISTVYNNTDSLDSSTNDYATVSFCGTQISLIGVRDPGYGIGAVSIDGSAETNVDFYNAIRSGNVLLWTSPTLAAGTHTLKLRVTGTRNASSTGYNVAPDGITVIGGTLTDFSSGLETTNYQPTWVSTVEPISGGLSNVSGIISSVPGPELAIRNETTHSGSSALMYSGQATSSTGSDYAYMEGFSVNIPVTSSTQLNYWIYPQSTATSSLVSGNNSSYVAVDLVFSNGASLRASSVTDQNGNRLNPASQGGHLTMDAWNNVVANLTSLAGKTIVRINVGYDHANSTGGYRGYVDDISITQDSSSPFTPPLFESGFESSDLQPTWNDTPDLDYWSSSNNPLNITGYLSGINPECSVRAGEQAHTGSSALMYSGSATGASADYCYYKVLNLTSNPITIGPNTGLSYWIYPQQDNGRYVGIDFHCTDGTTLRDSGSIDQNGNNMHPNAGHGGSIPLNAWSKINCNLGTKLNGKVVDRIWVAYDRANSSGQYRGYIDDIVITNGTLP